MTDAPSAAGATPGGASGRVAVLVLLPFAGGYFLSYLFRTVNSVIGEDLIAEVGLSAGDIGLLTATYLLTFAAFQIPLGILLDRFGPRRVNAALLAIAALGALLFSFADSLELLVAGRALIGLGVSAGLMASFKTITQWFPRNRWALVNGCFLAVGGLGAIAGTGPVQAALAIVDWRGVFQILSGATVCIAMLIFALVPEKREGVAHETLRGQIAGLLAIYRSRIFAAVAPLVITSMAANLALQGLWAGLWLRDVGGLDRGAAADVLVWLNVGLTAGFVLIGVAADYFGRRGIGLAPVTVIFIAVFCLAQVTIVFNLDVAPAIPWFVFGLASNASILCYPLMASFFSLELTGRTNTAVNLTAFLGAFAAQYAIGLIIDQFPASETGYYGRDAYRTAFGTLLALQIAGAVWFVYAFKRLRARQTSDADTIQQGSQP